MSCRDAEALWLGRRPADVLRAWTLRSLADIELDGVPFAQVIEPFAIHGALVKEVVLARVILDKPESLFDSNRSDRSCHECLRDYLRAPSLNGRGLRA